MALSGPGGRGDAPLRLARLAAGIVADGAAAVGATAAAIGPGIGPCCYEVGEEVLGAFRSSGTGSPTGGCSTCRRWRGGCSPRPGSSEIESAGLCTSCKPELFFSHRRDAGRTGRQAGLAWLNSEEA